MSIDGDEAPHYPRAVARSHRIRLQTPSPFELDVVLRGHGWVALAPHEYAREDEILRSALDLAALPGGRGPVVDLELRAAGTGGAVSVTVTGRQALSRANLERVRRAMISTLTLDLDLTPFWSRCAEVPRLRWVSRRGAGRLMRSPTLFEDLLKLLMTTNCSWANTKTMVRRTSETLGRPAPSGRRAFPSARVCAEQPESFWRDEIRVGYRAGHCRALAAGFADGTLPAILDPALPTAELRRRLLNLPGFGPYAAGQALRLLGHFDDLALDSWVRKRAAELHDLEPGDDRAIAACYAGFERYAGLALWMDMIADVDVETL